MACRTCPFQYEVKKKMYETIRMKRKEAEDVLGGKDAWENVDSTEGKFIDDLQTSTDRSVPCPEDSCDGARAFFYQVQIRSADEPMTTFYKVRSISIREDLADRKVCYLRQTMEGELVMMLHCMLCTIDQQHATRNEARKRGDILLSDAISGTQYQHRIIPL